MYQSDWSIGYNHGTRHDIDCSYTWKSSVRILLIVNHFPPWQSGSLVGAVVECLLPSLFSPESGCRQQLSYYGNRCSRGLPFEAMSQNQNNVRGLIMVHSIILCRILQIDSPPYGKYLLVLWYTNVLWERNPKARTVPWQWLAKAEATARTSVCGHCWPVSEH